MVAMAFQLDETFDVIVAIFVFLIMIPRQLLQKDRDLFTQFLRFQCASKLYPLSVFSRKHYQDRMK